MGSRHETACACSAAPDPRGESRERSAALTVAAGLNGPIVKPKVADLCRSVIAWIHALGTLS